MCNYAKDVANGMSKAPSEPGNEADLLQRVARRDREAFAELYRAYHYRLHGYLRRLLADRQIAEEVFDDVMFVVWKDARRFAGKSAISTWIFGIAYRRAMSALRKESRHQSRVDHGARTEDIAATEPSGRNLVAVALRRLSPDHRQVVELTYYFGLSYSEIAEIAGCPVNTVKTRMFHARKRLKHLLPVLEGKTEGRDRENA